MANTIHISHVSLYAPAEESVYIPVEPESITSSESISSPLVTTPIEAELQYTITFTITDIISTAPQELYYELWTGIEQTGTRLAYGYATSGTEVTTSLVYDPDLELGINDRYLTTWDGAFNKAESIVPVQYVLHYTLHSQGLPSEEAFGIPQLSKPNFQTLVVPAITDESYISEPVRISHSLPLPEVPFNDYFVGKFGSVEYEFGMRYYNNDQILLGDFSDDVLSMQVSWDSESVIKRELAFTHNPRCGRIPKAVYVEPYAIFKYRHRHTDEQLEQEYVLGFYKITSRKMTITNTVTELALTAQDRTIWLTEKTLEEPLTIPAGGNYGSKIRQLAMEAGFQDRDISLPIADIINPTAITFEAGTTYYEILSMLASAINWTAPYMTNDNKLRCIEQTDLTERTPSVRYATDEESIILPDVQYEQNEERVPNQIKITVNDPLRDPFTITYNNNHIDNPYSRVVTGKTVTHVIEDLNYIASEEAALHRAKIEAQTLSGNIRIELRTWPDFRREPHEIYNVHVLCPVTQQVLVQNIWYCTSWSIPLEVGGEMTHQLRNIFPV